MKSGDIILMNGSGCVARWIRVLTRSPGERPTLFTHIALAIDDASIVEATFRGVRSRSYKPRASDFIYSPKFLTSKGRRSIAQRGVQYVGAPYGYGKIVLHALDGLLLGAYVFRRLAFLDRAPICSWVVAIPYWEVSHYKFAGKVPTSVSPDDIADDVTNNKEYFSCSKH